MSEFDDDWSGAAYAQDSRAGDTLAAHLQANGILPPGHVIVNVQAFLRATVAPAGLKAPYLTVTMFDASGARDPAAAYRQAIEDGEVEFPIVHVQVTMSSVKRIAAR
ncbi:hypothetical protein [Ralstonia mannitolilytica]|uniref:hypothetical protein n=1 Tax=Ralstonia mannitolilytica TaxID=105219 RepID=UPI0028F5628F|nr:hypothetical protein [Ralstonia mannitolilytica]CAJ0716955.1 hypothetical protein LMG8323_03418 [Ralstonia mannitolilytica]